MWGERLRLSAPTTTERRDKVQVVKEVDAAIEVEVRRGFAAAERGNKVQIIKEVDGVIAIEIGGAACSGQAEAGRDGEEDVAYGADDQPRQADRLGGQIESLRSIVGGGRKDGAERRAIVARQLDLDVADADRSDIGVAQCPSEIGRSPIHVGICGWRRDGEG